MKLLKLMWLAFFYLHYREYSGEKASAVFFNFTWGLLPLRNEFINVRLASFFNIGPIKDRPCITGIVKQIRKGKKSVRRNLSPFRIVSLFLSLRTGCCRHPRSRSGRCSRKPRKQRRRNYI